MKLKNHKVIQQLLTFEDLMPVLYNRKSIYFAPAGRILPTKFFMGWSWMSGAVKKHLESGAFYEVESYEDISRRRIKNLLKDCWKGVGVQLSFEEAIKMTPIITQV